MSFKQIKLHNQLYMIYLVSNRFQADQTETKTSILTTLSWYDQSDCLLEPVNEWTVRKKQLQFLEHTKLV